MSIRWFADATDLPTAVRGEDDRRRALPLDAIDRRHIAVIVGLTVAALVALFFGDHLAMWAGVR